MLQYFQMLGLIYCFNNTWISGFCTQKLLECILSFIIALVAILQIYYYFKTQGCTLNTRLIIFLQVILASISNGLLCVFHEILLFFYLETFFFNIYFVTIVYYVTKKLLYKIYPDKTYTITILIFVYILFLMFYLFMLVDSTLLPKKRCEQIWYVAIRLIGLILAISLFILAKINHTRQQSMLLQYNSIKTINNPLSRLWTWIGFNIIAQLANIIISIVFLFDTSIDCKYNKNVNKKIIIVQNSDLNYFIAFIMIVLTFDLPFMSTLYIFWTPIFKAQIQQNRQREQSIERYHNGIQIMSVRSRSLSK